MDNDTKSFSKLWEYYKDLTKDPAFLDEVERIRFQYILDDLDKDSIEKLFQDYAGLPLEIDLLATVFGLDSFAWRLTLKAFILEGELVKPISHPYGTDLCELADIQELQHEATAWQIQAMKYKTYPVIIRVSPYASKNDILDFIEKNYTEYIKPNQEKFANKSNRIGKSRKKSDFVDERNSFIYKNKDLPYSEIMKLLGENFGMAHVIDSGYIGKIISNENKKRSGTQKNSK